MPMVNIHEENPLLIKTIFTQEMLRKGFLAATAIYMSSAHTKAIIDNFLGAAEKVFSKISRTLKDKTVEKMLEGPVCHSGFKRVV